ncbi:MAG: hypothetical protein R3E87_15035 [Burkholderiaceae bacterium]
MSAAVVVIAIVMVLGSAGVIWRLVAELNRERGRTKTMCAENERLRRRIKNLAGESVFSEVELQRLRLKTGEPLAARKAGQ